MNISVKKRDRHVTQKTNFQEMSRLQVDRDYWNRVLKIQKKIKFLADWNRTKSKVWPVL